MIEIPWVPEPLIEAEQITIGLVELAFEVYHDRHQDIVFNIHAFLADVANESVWDHRTDPVFFPTSRCSAYRLMSRFVEGWRPPVLGDEHRSSRGAGIDL